MGESLDLVYMLMKLFVEQLYILVPIMLFKGFNLLGDMLFTKLYNLALMRFSDGKT